MDQLGTNFNSTGSVMTPEQRQEQRRKRGECVTCGQKCFQRRLFSMVPITNHGKVLNGRCLNCHPLDSNDTADGGAIPAVSRPATKEDLQRFRLKQEQLNIMSARSSSSLVSAPASGGSGRPQLSTRAASMMGVTSVSSGHSNSQASAHSSPATHSTRVSSRGLTSQSHSSAISVSSTDSGSFAGTTRSDNVSSLDERPSDLLTSPVSGRSYRSLPVPGHRNNSRDSLDLAGTGERGTESLPSSGDLAGLRDDIRRRRSHQDVEDDLLSSPPESYRADLDPFHSHGYHQDMEKPSQQDLRAAMERIMGYEIDDEEAYALMASGMEPAELLEDLRQTYQSTRSHSVRSFEDPEYEAGRQGVLNRGGAVAFPGDSSPVRRGSFADGTYSNTSLQSSGSLHDRDAAMMRMNMGVPPGSRGHAAYQSTSALHHAIAREASMRSVHSEVPGGHYHERRHQPPDRRFSNSSAHSSRSHQGANLQDHFSRHSFGRSSDVDDSGHNDSYSTGALSRNGYRTRVTRRNSGSGSVTPRDDTEVGLERLEDAGPDYLEIVRIMRDCPGSAEVQLNCMEELSNFNFADDDYDTLLEVGAMEVITDAMQAFPQDMILQMCGCRAMCNTSGTPETQLCYAEFGAIDLALDAMGLFLEYPRMQEQGLAALANLAATQENISELIDKGCVPQAVAAMNKYPGDVDVQLKGCSVITNLSSHSLDIRSAIMEASGGGAVVLAMVLHAQEPEVQEKALRALRNLSSNNDGIKVELAHMGGIDAVVQAMKVHRDDAIVQEAGACTLCSLAGNPDNKAMIGQCGGIDVTIRAMWVHSDSASVVEWCCQAIYSLSLNQDNRAKILEVGGITAAVNTMQAHAESSVVQEMGCAILCNLAIDDESAKEKIVAEEALDAIVLAMVLFSEDVGVQERACHVLLQLANEANLRSMQASNVGELVRAAAARFPQRCEGPANELTHVLDGLTANYNSNNAAIAAS